MSRTENKCQHQKFGSFPSLVQTECLPCPCKWFLPLPFKSKLGLMKNTLYSTVQGNLEPLKLPSIRTGYGHIWSLFNYRKHVNSQQSGLVTGTAKNCYLEICLLELDPLLLSYRKQLTPGLMGITTVQINPLCTNVKELLLLIAGYIFSLL